MKSVRVPAAKQAAFSGFSWVFRIVHISKEVSCPQLGQETGISADSEGFQVGPDSDRFWTELGSEELQTEADLEDAI